MTPSSLARLVLPSLALGALLAAVPSSTALARGTSAAHRAGASPGRVTLRASTTTAGPAERLVLTGSSTKAGRRREVAIYARAGANWTLLARTRLSRSGSFGTHLALSGAWVNRTVDFRAMVRGVGRSRPVSMFVRGQDERRSSSNASVALFYRNADAYDGAIFDPAAEAPRVSLWIAQGFHSDLIPQLSAANPSTVSYLYKEGPYSDALSSQPATGPINTGGVTYSEAATDHPDWLLLDSSGRQITNDGYAGYHLMDIGNVGYQDEWARNAVAEAKRDGWSGIYVDDLSLALHGASATPAKYPTPAAWQAAVASFLANVGAQVRDADLKFIVNINCGVSWPSVRDRWLQYVDGTMEEGWMRPSVDPTQPLASSANGDWNRQLGEETASEREGKYFLAELPAYPWDSAAVRYGLATELLGAAGRSSFDVSGFPVYTRALWYPDYDAARRLGPPLGTYTELAGGVYRRDFANGAVLVNPTESTRTVALGATYSGDGLSNATSVAMAATTGLVLLAG
jgi:hypothetical protein